MMVHGRCVGGLVFGRFGGPSYPPEHIRLAEFVAWHVGQLLENRRMARRIATLEAQRELARMQDEFISTISHELRTPLGFIKGYVTTLMRKDATWEPETRMEFLQIVDEEADRLRELIDNLLDSSRLETGTLGMTREPIKLGSLIRDSVSRTKSAYPEMKVDVELPEDLPSVYVDPTRVSQVIDNLLSNANKYAPNAVVRIRSHSEDNQVQIEVEDTGPGIAPQHIPHLFERFYRVPEQNSNVRGTGLGLYICRKIIEAHNGEIGVESREGTGTRIYFTLPLLATQPVPEAEHER
jgi:signal transduction histidine kinase